MEQRDGTTTVEVNEPGFEGQVVIEAERGFARRVRISGVRPQDGSNVVKEVPADRDVELAALADRLVAGDPDAPARLVAHLGVVDPPATDQPPDA